MIKQEAIGLDKPYKKSAWHLKKTLTTKEFIARSEKVHNHKYDYSKTAYGKNNTDKVIIICKVHGEFTQAPKQHLKGEGCTKCGYESFTKTANDRCLEYVEKAKTIHNDFYDYTDLINNYKKLHCKYNIICPVHGEFSQSFAAHIHHKAGCPHCYAVNRNGFNSLKWINNANNYNPILYLARLYNDNEQFLKIGITYNTIKQRFAHYSSAGYKYEILSEIKVIKHGGRAIALMELELHLGLQEYKYKPQLYFKGQGECYKYENLSEIIKRIRFELDLMRMNLMLFEDLVSDCYIIGGEYSQYLNNVMSYTGNKTI